MKTLVIGGAGLVGSTVVKELGKRDVDVRVFARKKSAVTDADKEGLEVAEGDLLDPATVEKALDGVDKLYLLNAVSPDELTQGLRGTTARPTMSMGRRFSADPASPPSGARRWAKKFVTRATTWKLSRRKCANRHQPGRRSTFA